uniref:Uncharacterized protein n=1 Tax=Anguilla anguilla TaxID=7936 RepID=A0A0E9XC99_ANGAN
MLKAMLLHVMSCNVFYFEIHFLLINELLMALNILV